ncbi:uncharacterized protein LOC120681312 [Panicum virgatum]|uniref:uncharacterized protein LOC120681312 n=1 Tax=Panicum virgatum TaxID=38727 RepID=UPI0019D69590|nr:uncharacterized protein LOC120681312 [Panicum virgatum]
MLNLRHSPSSLSSSSLSPHESLHLLRGLPLWIDPLGPCTQASEAIKKVVFGGQVTEEEADSLTKRKPCSAPKWKEMTGSGIFAAGSNGDAGEAAAAAKPARTAPRQVPKSVLSFCLDTKKF